MGSNTSMLCAPSIARRRRMSGRSSPQMLAMFVLFLLLAACGMQPTPPPSPPPTRLVPTVSDTPIATPQPTPLPPVTPTPLPELSPTPFSAGQGGVGATCGLIEIRDGKIVEPIQTANAEECFWQAYQHCAITENLFVVHTRTDTPSYSSFAYGLMITGGRCTVEISGGGVPVVVDAKGTRTVGGVPIGDRCTGMSRDTLGDVLFTGCGMEQQWNLMAP